MHKALDFMQEIFSCSFNSSVNLKRMFTNANSDFVAKRSGKMLNRFNPASNFILLIAPRRCFCGGSFVLSLGV